MTCAALVTAGGHGTRMGHDIPKQYLEIHGIPILARTLLVFEMHPMIDTIVLTVPLGDEDFCRSHIIAPFGLKKISHVVNGGETRQQSVLNGLESLTQTDMVAIHDGVRPLVSAQTISETVEAARSTGASVACVPVRDTVKKQNGKYLETVSRTSLWLAHTPQTFRTSLILDAHRRAAADRFIGTDDASLVERMGRPVAIVRDAYTNLKITTPDDLELAKILIERIPSDGGTYGK
jgi:2-C-methyl-D-erythritol 4-phosphate cytidylyltransferase